MDRVSLPPKPPSVFEGSIQNQDLITRQGEVFFSLWICSHEEWCSEKTGSKMRHLGMFSWRTFLNNTGLPGSFSLRLDASVREAHRSKEWEGWGRTGGWGKSSGQSKVWIESRSSPFQRYQERHLWSCLIYPQTASAKEGHDCLQSFLLKFHSSR